MRRLAAATVLFILILPGLGCDNNSTAPIDGDNARWLVKTPEGGNQLTLQTDPGFQPPSNAYSDEATDLATWWSGELYAPEDLKQQIATELRKIRRKFSGVYPKSKIEFIPVYAPGQLLVGFTEAGWAMWQNGDYHAWDSLNTALKVDSIIQFGLWPGTYHVLVYFDGRPNVRKLVEIYSDLPELQYVHGNEFCCDWPVVLMWRDENVVHYFFRDGWGDCPAGCIYEDYHYFTIINGEPFYIGYYLHTYEYPFPRPDWMDIADLAWAKYWPF